MIQETCTRIEELEDFWTAQMAVRNARRNKIREIDDLLNQFEMLNLADELTVPLALRSRAARLVGGEDHPLGEREPALVSIPDWMEALYDIQDGLMVRFPDDIE